MKWVALAIIACVIPYTWITVKYRKDAPAYQPYEDSKERANVMRLLEAGYQRIRVSAERPADPQQAIQRMTAPVTASPAPGGIPQILADTLVETPTLPLTFSSVSAPGETDPLLPYPIAFASKLEDGKQQVGGAHVFLRDESLVIIPQLERLDNNLSARAKENPVVITIPGGLLKTGRYTVLLAGSEQSQQWIVEVR